MLKIMLFMLSFFLLACNDSLDSNSSNEISNFANKENIEAFLNSYDFSYNDNPGVNISFSHFKYGECIVSMERSSLKEGAFFEVSSAEGGVFDFSCLLDDNLFILDETDSTFSKIRIELGSDGGFFVKLSGNLYAIRRDLRLNVEDVRLLISKSELKK